MLCSGKQHSEWCLSSHHKQWQSQKENILKVYKENKTVKEASYEHESIFLDCLFLLKIAAKGVESRCDWKAIYAIYITEMGIKCRIY